MSGKMNARERWGLLLIDEFPDRPPVYPLITSHSADVYGCSLIDYCTNGRILAESQLAAQQEYQHDGLSVFTDVGIIAEAFGSRYLLRETDVPIILEPVLDVPEKIADLKIPDPQNDGRLPVYLEAIEHLFEKAGDHLPVFAFIPCPFTTAAGLRGTENFLMDSILDPKNMHRILKNALEAAIKFCDECILSGALPVLVDPLASGSVISRKTYIDFAMPYQKSLIHYLHRYDLDITLHVCGDTSLIADLIPDTGADLFSFDKLDVVEAVQTAGDRSRLVGNLPPNDLLASSKLNIEQYCSHLLEHGISNPTGFVYSTGCEVPIRCDRNRLQKMIELGFKSRYNHD